MTIKKILLILSSGLLVVNCVSPSKSTSLVVTPVPEELPMDAILPQHFSGRAPASVEAGSGYVTFEQAVNTPVDGLSANPNAAQLLEDAKKYMKNRRKFGAIGAFLRICKEDANHPFCIAYKYKDLAVDHTRTKKSKISLSVVKKQLEKKNYEALKDVNVQSLIKAAKKLKFATLKDVSTDLAGVNTCMSEDIYIALGSILELDFPSDDVVNLNNQLLDKAQKCYDSENTSRAAFRLGMFKVWKNQCDEAIPLFDSTIKDQSVKYLHARSAYWNSFCRTQAGKEKPESDGDFYRDFPQSFNSLLADDGPTPLAYNLLASAVDPLVKLRTDNNPKFNALLDTLDAFIKIGEDKVAFNLIQSLKTEQIQNEEPQALLYFAVLCNRVQFGLLKFKLLTKVFEKSPQFRSLNTMKLFYPAWYLEIVTTFKDKINPYLIMALIRQESAFNPRAHSAADARGLMQLLPGTGRQFGKVPKHQLFDPKKNIDSGVRFFSYLMKRYNNQVHLALAAYNAGPLTVDSWLKLYPTENPLLFTDMVPYKETRDYVGSILRNWYWYSQLYGNATFPQQVQNDN
jgi:soluble lytic murein transglycosylase